MRVIAYSQLSDVRQEVDFTGDILRIGRDAANDLELPSPFVSREHARLLKRDSEYFIENVGLNGTLVEEHLVGLGEQVRITPGQEIHIGEWALYLVAEAAAGRPADEAMKIRRQHTPLAKAMEIENKVHSELLRRLNLRAIEVGPRTTRATSATSRRTSAASSTSSRARWTTRAAGSSWSSS